MSKPTRTGGTNRSSSLRLVFILACSMTLALAAELSGSLDAPMANGYPTNLPTADVRRPVEQTRQQTIPAPRDDPTGPVHDQEGPSCQSHAMADALLHAMPSLGKRREHAEMAEALYRHAKVAYLPDTIVRDFDDWCKNAGRLLDAALAHLVVEEIPLEEVDFTKGPSTRGHMVTLDTTRERMDVFKNFRAECLSCKGTGCNEDGLEFLESEKMRKGARVLALGDSIRSTSWGQKGEFCNTIAKGSRGVVYLVDDDSFTIKWDSDDNPQYSHHSHHQGPGTSHGSGPNGTRYNADSTIDDIVAITRPCYKRLTYTILQDTTLRGARSDESGRRREICTLCKGDTVFVMCCIEKDSEVRAAVCVTSTSSETNDRKNATGAAGWISLIDLNDGSEWARQSAHCCSECGGTGMDAQGRFQFGEEEKHLSEFAKYRRDVCDPCECGHAMAFVPTSLRTGYTRAIKNSWGTDWATEGYLHAKREFFEGDADWQFYNVRIAKPHEVGGKKSLAYMYEYVFDNRARRANETAEAARKRRKEQQDKRRRREEEERLMRAPRRGQKVAYQGNGATITSVKGRRVTLTFDDPKQDPRSVSLMRNRVYLGAVTRRSRQRGNAARRVLCLQRNLAGRRLDQMRAALARRQKEREAREAQELREQRRREEEQCKQQELQRQEEAAEEAERAERTEWEAEQRRQAAAEAEAANELKRKADAEAAEEKREADAEAAEFEMRKAARLRRLADVPPESQRRQRPAFG